VNEYTDVNVPIGVTEVLATEELLIDSWTDDVSEGDPLAEFTGDPDTRGVVEGADVTEVLASEELLTDAWTEADTEGDPLTEFTCDPDTRGVVEGADVTEVLAREVLLTDAWTDDVSEDEPLADSTPLNEACILWDTDDDPEEDARGVAEEADVPDTLPIGELLADSLFEDDPDTVVRDDADSNVLDDVEGTPDTLAVARPDKEGWTDGVTDGEPDVDDTGDTESTPVTLPDILCVVDSDCVTDGEDESDDWNDEDWPFDGDAKGDVEDDIDEVLVDTTLWEGVVLYADVTDESIDLLGDPEDELLLTTLLLPILLEEEGV